VEAPHFNDGSKPETSDKLILRAPPASCSPLRLRGGNGELDENTDNQTDNGLGGGQISITPTNIRKRKAAESPPGTVPANITAESMAIDRHVNDCKLFLQDMQSATKIGKKWLQGIEDYLAKIQSCSNNIALEAAVISGKYQEAKIVASEANHRLETCLSDINSIRTLPKRLYASTVRGDNEGQTEVGVEDDLMIVEMSPPPDQRRSVKERLGDFPPLGEQIVKRKKRQKTRPAITNTDRINAAKSKPVLPAFIIDGKDKSLKLDDIWKVVSSKIPNPRLDGCRRTRDGNFVLTSSDKETMDAIRSISEGLTIREQGPRKPRLRLKGIPVEYSAEFITESIVNQNQQLLEQCTTADIRPLFRCGRRSELDTDWVVEVSPAAYGRLNGKRIYLGMISTFPKPFIVAPHCRRCLQTDHRTADCSAESATCLHCAKPGHNRKDCPNKSDKPACAHCKGNHATMAKECLVWASTVRALQLRTDYGKPDDP